MRPYNPFDNTERDFIIKVRGLTFEGKFPLPKDETAIDLLVRESLNGVVLDTVPGLTYGREFVRWTLNKVLTVLPEAFPKQPPKFDWGDMPDPAFTDEVFAAYRAELKKFGERKKNGDPEGEPAPPADSGKPAESIPDKKPGGRARRAE